MFQQMSYSSIPSQDGLRNNMNEIKEQQEEIIERTKFLEGFAVAFAEKLHTDIEVKAGTGPSIPAHRALLATRSQVFKTMLEWDERKAPPSGSISLPELTHEELQCLLHFLYSGEWPSDDVNIDQRRLCSLLVAADKYDIPFLKKQCEKQILGSLDASNALEILEISEICSSEKLKESTIGFVLKHMEEVVFSHEYETFAQRNAHLCVELTRAHLKEYKDREPFGTFQKPIGTSQNPFGTSQYPFGFGTFQKPTGTSQNPFGTFQKPIGSFPFAGNCN